jgi:hypothetical protein
VTFLWWFGATVLVTGAVLFASKRTRRKVWRAVKKAHQKRQKAKIRANARAKRQAAKRAPQRATPRRSSTGGWQPAQPVNPEPRRVPRKPILRAQRCSAACRTSRKPASTCDCACGGRDHGRYRPNTAAAIRATKYTKAQQVAQRRAEAKARNDRWAEKQKKLQDKVVVTRGGKGTSKR